MPSLCGKVWLDADKDGTLDADETTFFDGVFIKLTTVVDGKEVTVST